MRTFVGFFFVNFNDFKCFKYVSDKADENAGDAWKENINKGCLAFVEKIKSTYNI